MSRDGLSKLDRVFFTWLLAIGAVAAAGLAAGMLLRGDQCGGYLMVLAVLYVFGIGLRGRRGGTLSRAARPPATAPHRRDHEEEVRPRDLARKRSRWDSVDRVFLTVLKVIAVLAVSGTVLAMMARGRCLEAFLLGIALMFVLGLGPFQFRPRHAGAR